MITVAKYVGAFLAGGVAALTAAWLLIVLNPPQR